ncbi:MAG: SDR family oxidoreductase [Desulfobacterales bacterium]
MAKTILITGATSGFGEACARRFAQDGQKLILIGRRTSRLEKLADDLKSLSPVHILTLDIRVRHEVEKNLGNLPENFSHVDVLINNAGLALGMEPANEADMDDWETMVDTNIKGLMYCTRMVLSGMVARNRGHIINIGSIAGDWPYPGGNVYGATKAFVKQFSRNLRADLLGKAIRVTNIEPGMAESEFSLVRFKGDIQKAVKVYEGTKALTSEDIAEIIHWAVNLPPHININRLEVMPTCQSWGHLAVDRKN